jgi:hypothetical protein
MIDIDGDIWPRKGKGRAEEVIEGLRGTSAVLKHPNSESSLDRGVSGASHFPGVRGTKLLYIRRKLFLSSSHSRDATSNMGGIPTFFCGVCATVATFSMVFLAFRCSTLSRLYLVRFLVS